MVNLVLRLQFVSHWMPPSPAGLPAQRFGESKVPPAGCAAPPSPKRRGAAASFSCAAAEVQEHSDVASVGLPEIL
jgi:hypothetical protein